MYLVRHGETEWNRDGRRQGRGDSPLTERGVRHAEACAELIAGHQGSSVSRVRVLTSPLGRAHATAKIICERLGLDVMSCIAAPELAEHDFGAWEGLTNTEIESRFPGEIERRLADHWDYVIPGGESYALLARRAGRLLGSLDNEVPTILVTHDMVSRVMRGLYARMPPAETLTLRHRQDVVYVLNDGEVSCLERVDRC
jgi:probable phosphoglycerate mutase